MENWALLIVGCCLLYMIGAVNLGGFQWPLFLIARIMGTVTNQDRIDSAMDKLDSLFEARHYELRKAVEDSDRVLADQILSSMDDVSHERADVAMRLLRESVDQALDN